MAAFSSCPATEIDVSSIVQALRHVANQMDEEVANDHMSTNDCRQRLLVALQSLGLAHVSEMDSPDMTIQPQDTTIFSTYEKSGIAIAEGIDGKTERGPGRLDSISDGSGSIRLPPPLDASTYQLTSNANLKAAAKSKRANAHAKSIVDFHALGLGRIKMPRYSAPVLKDIAKKYGIGQKDPSFFSNSSLDGASSAWVAHCGCTRKKSNSR
jgi:hypothetical protein